MDDSPQLTIGEVAHRAGVATSSIRYYESIGLLPVPDRMHGQRRYDPDVLGQLAFIGVAQSAGFKLEEIKDLMRGADAADGMGEQMRELSRRKLGEVEEMLARAAADEGLARGRQHVRLRVARPVHAVPGSRRRVRRVGGAAGGRGRRPAAAVANRPGSPRRPAPVR